MLAPLALTALTMAGMAQWLPNPARPGSSAPGLRWLGGLALALVVYFVLHVGLGLGLSASAHTVAALAVAGLARLAWTRPPLMPVLRHPAVILLGLVAAVNLIHGQVHYRPVAWDEINNYLSWVRQGFVADRMMDARFFNGVIGIGYIPGWAMLMGYPGQVLGRFSEGDGLAVITVFHLAMLAAVYDVVTLGRQGRDDGPVLGWLLVLGLLAVEASWKLVPTHLWVEKPQIYLLVVLFGLGLVAGRQGLAPLPGALMVGMVIAAGLLIKNAMLVALLMAAPAILLLGWRPAAPWPVRLRTLAVVGALTLAPLVAVEIAWAPFVQEQSCYASPLPLIRGFLAGESNSAQALDLASRFFGAVWDYAGTYKAWLSLAALAMLVLAARRRGDLLVVGGLLAWVSAYFAGLYLYHLYCFGSWYFENLNSIDRFTRMPLRVLHVVGPMLLALTVPPLPRLIRQRPAWMLAALLAGWQGWQATRSLDEVEKRLTQGEVQLALAQRIEHEALDLASRLEERPETGPVLQIMQNGSGYEWVLGHYALIGQKRGDPVERLPLKPAWSWSTSLSNHDIRQQWLSARALWPLHLDGPARAILEPMIADPACRARPEDYFLVRNGAGTGFDCLSKRH